MQPDLICGNLTDMSILVHPCRVGADVLIPIAQSRHSAEPLAPFGAIEPGRRRRTAPKKRADVASADIRVSVSAFGHMNEI